MFLRAKIRRKDGPTYDEQIAAFKIAHGVGPHEFAASFASRKATTPATCLSTSRSPRSRPSTMSGRTTCSASSGTRGNANVSPKLPRRRAGGRPHAQGPHLLDVCGQWRGRRQADLLTIGKAAPSFEGEAEMRAQGVNRAFMLRIGVAVPLADNDDLEPEVVAAARRQHGRGQPASLRIPERQEKRHLPPNMGFQPDILLERGS